MPKGMQPLLSYTVTATSVTGINLSNIPQTYTDLLIKASLRTVGSAGNVEPIVLAINQDTFTVYSMTTVGYDGSSTTSYRTNNNAYLSYHGQLSQNSPGSTANTFSVTELYIPNYRSSKYKQIIIDSVAEGNSTTASVGFGSGLHRSTVPVTGLKIVAYTGSGLAQNTTISVYGISR